MSNLQLTEFVKRPNVGNTGRATRVRANFFEVQSFPENNIHHYDITITPDVPPVINRKIWKTFEDQDGQGSLNGIKPVYDGRKNVFSSRALPLEDDAGMFEVRIDILPMHKPRSLPFKSAIALSNPLCSLSIHHYSCFPSAYESCFLSDRPWCLLFCLFCGIAGTDHLNSLFKTS